MCYLAVTCCGRAIPRAPKPEKEGSLQNVNEGMGTQGFYLLSSTHHGVTQLLNYSSYLGKLLCDGVFASVDQ